MKNKSVLRAFGIMLLFTFLLTWVIKSATIGEAGITIGGIEQTGYADIFTAFEVICTYFAMPAIFILFVGMFYGVANKSGSFKAVVNKMVSAFKNTKNVFIILTVLFYAVTTALTGMYLQLFMFIPLSIAILLGLKYTKSQSILATVGASTIGLTAQVFNPFMKNMTGAETDKFLFVRVGLLVLLVALTIVYTILISAKKDEKTENEIMFTPEARNAKKKVTVKGTSFYIIMALLFIVFVLGLTTWNTDVFTKAYDWVKNVKIGQFAILDTLLGGFETFGSWTYLSLMPTIALATVLLGLFTRLSVGEIIEGSYEGAKKLVGVAFLTAILNLILIFTLNSGFAGTIINLIAKSGNIALVSLSLLLTTPFMVDVNYAAQYILSMLYYTTNNQDMLPLYGFALQSIFGVVALIAPSSVMLVAGLYYTEESYSKWFKYIWKFLLGVFVLVIIAIVVAKII